MSNKNIVVIGGGTGSFVTLQAVKKVSSSISAIVTMVDNGGSTGRLRDQYGVLPVGDVRQCLLALSNDIEDFRELLNYRFPGGDLHGHNFGNILLVALEQTSEDIDEAVKKASKILNITGEVVPITKQSTSLLLYDGQKLISGQRNIDDSKLRFKKPKLELKPSVKISTRAKERIATADFILFAPGSLYDSVISSLLVEGVKEAIDGSDAKLIQIINLVTKPGHTDNWQVKDFVLELNRFLGDKKIDAAIYNTEEPTADMLKQYLKDNEMPVQCSDTDTEFKLYGADMIAKFDRSKELNDELIKERTLIRHDINRLSTIIEEAISLT